MLNLLFSNSKIHVLDVYSFVRKIKKKEKTVSEKNIFSHNK